MGKRTCTAEGCEEKHYAHGWCQRHYQSRRAEVAERTCSLDGCDEGHYARDLCRTHWKRWRKTGDPGPSERLRIRPPSECLADDCDAQPRARGLCIKHYQRWQDHGDPNAEVHHSGWRGDEVGYTAMHERIYRMRGSATDHVCQRCGKPATDWAYDHNDPNEREELGKGPYSIDPTHYMPLCHSCHMKLDHNGWD